jgi:dolichol-phosphate mannosyltransferase
MTKNYLEISVVLPAFNEKDNIKIAVGEADKYLKRNFSRYEIIVVDDGGSDGTDEIVKRIMKKNSHIRLVKHPVNRGYGAALRSGFLAAKMKKVFYTDSDCQFDISDLDRIMPWADKYDMVIGYRENRQDPLMRIFIARTYNLLIRLAFGLKVRDVDCSFKLYDRQIFQQITMTSETGLIDAEVLTKALRKGFTIKEIGVRHFPRTRGTTMYETGKRNKFWAFVRPEVITDLLKEIAKLKSEMK